MGHRPFWMANTRMTAVIGMMIIQRTRLGLNRT